MNILIITGLFIALTSVVLMVLLIIYGKTKLHRIWFLTNLVIFVWGLGCFFIGRSSAIPDAYFWWRIAIASGVFIAPFFYHTSCIFADIKQPKRLILSYIEASLFAILALFTEITVIKLKLLFNTVYYPVGNLAFLLMVISWVVVIFLGTNVLVRLLRKSSGIRHLQTRYLIIAFLSGFIGGGATLLPAFNLPFKFIYPYGNFGVALYAIIGTYAILRYRLLDFNIVLTRTTIFIAVYSIVLGLPFLLAFGWQEKLIKFFADSWWLAPLVTSTVLATAGPFIYLYIDKKAEERLLEEQLRYQNTLRQASAGMGRIKDLNRLINLIVHIVTRTVRLEHAVLYLDDPDNKRFVFGAKRSRTVRFHPQDTIEKTSALYEQLMQTRSPIIYEEIMQRTQDFGDRKLAKLEAEMKELDAAVVVPSFIDERLLAIIILGEKVSKKVYSEDDLAVFSILSNQAALAIENAMFYDDMKQTHEQLFKAEKMATIGTMADGLSHQINNRLHALGFIAGDALDTIKMKKNVEMTPELKEMIIDIEHALARIQDNVAQGGDVVRGLLKYTRKGEEGLSDIVLEDLINAAIEMTQFKIKPGAINIIKEFGADIPVFKGNFTQLQEVFFNLIDNAFDAMMERKESLGEEGFKPTIKISADFTSKNIKIIFRDNGIGIKGEDQDKLFTPFYTTKLSSKKGTGLGLYVIQKLIEENHKGRVKYESTHKEGTTVNISLPIENEGD